MSHKKILAIVAAFLLGMASLAVYFYFQFSIGSRINAALMQYINERILFAANEASDGKAVVAIEDISYNFLANSAVIHGVRIEYQDSTRDSSTEITLHVPAIAVSGLRPWDLFFGYGLHIGSIVIDKPEFTFEANGNKGAIRAGDDDLSDTSAFSLPDIPNVDSLVQSFAMSFLPGSLAPLTIDSIEVRNANGVYSNVSGAHRLSGRYENVDLMIANIKISNSQRTTKRAIRNVRAHVGLLRHFSKQSTSLATAGIDVTVNPTDTALTIDSFRYQIDTSYTYKLSGISISFSRQIISLDSFSIMATQSDDSFFAIVDNGSDLFRASGRGLELRDVDMGMLTAKQGLIVRTATLKRGTLSVVSRKTISETRRSGKSAPPMLYEILRKLPFDLDVDSIGISQIAILYEEHYPEVQTPAALDLKNVVVNVTALSNIERSQRKKPLTLYMSGLFLNHAPMTATVVMPLNTDKYRIMASGSVSNLNITKLNSFLPVAEKVKISDGYLETSTFKFELIGRKARGYVDAKYKNLVIDVLDEHTRRSTVLTDVTSWLFNMIAIRNDNEGKAFKRGRINYTMRRNAAIMQTFWFPVRAGLSDVIGF